MRRGFTIIEILVSCVLLATGILIAMSVLSFGLKATTGSSLQTEATAFSRTLSEIVLSGGPRAPILTGNKLNPDYDDKWRRLYDVDKKEVAPPFQMTDFVRTNDARDSRRFVERAKNFDVKVTCVANPIDEGLVNVTIGVRWFDRFGRRSLITHGIYRRE